MFWKKNAGLWMRQRLFLSALLGNSDVSDWFGTARVQCLRGL